VTNPFSALACYRCNHETARLSTHILITTTYGYDDDGLGGYDYMEGWIMSKIGMLTVIVLCIGSVGMGLMSYHFSELHNWIMTYISSGLSVLMPVLAWKMMGD
jgi:hypothetical protein